MPRLLRRLLPLPRHVGWPGQDDRCHDGTGLDAVDVLDLDVALPADDEDPYGLDAWWERG